MTFTVSPWLVWAGASLVLFGAWFVLSAVGDGLRQLWGWAWRERIDPPWWWKPWLYRFRDGDQDAATEDEELLPLPPERSWEQMTSHQLPITGTIVTRYCAACGSISCPGVAAVDYCPDWQAAEARRARGEYLTTHPLGARRERRPPAYEAEHRAHYVAMGFDYPSGLMARVRELVP